jgi:hypothetical protein
MEKKRNFSKGNCISPSLNNIQALFSLYSSSLQHPSLSLVRPLPFAQINLILRATRLPRRKTKAENEKTQKLNFNFIPDRVLLRSMLL